VVGRASISGRRLLAAGALTLLTLVATSCVGTISREDFNAKIQSRGGGLDQQLALDAVAAVGDRVGTHDFEITSMRVTPNSAVVTMQVRDPHHPGNLDDYTFRSGELDDPKAVQLSATDDIDSKAFPVQSVALNKLNGMVDTALKRYATEGGYVTSMSIVASFESGVVTPKITLGLESPRSKANATFDAHGNFLSLDKV
jgi:hypothetical protein